MIEETELQELFRYAMLLTQQRDDALDLLQSSVESYIRKTTVDRIKVNEPKAYIRTSIRNQFFDGSRKDKRWQYETFAEETHYDISPIDLESFHILQEDAENLWAELDSRDRDILYHWVILGYSTDEACQALNLSRGTFLSRMHRLRKRYAHTSSKTLDNNLQEKKR